MPEGIGYGAPVSGSNANASTQRTNASERGEAPREESRTREEARPRQATRAEGGVDVQSVNVLEQAQRRRKNKVIPMRIQEHAVEVDLTFQTIKSRA